MYSLLKVSFLPMTITYTITHDWLVTSSKVFATSGHKNDRNPLTMPWHFHNRNEYHRIRQRNIIEMVK